MIAGPDEAEGENLLGLISELNLSQNVFLIGALENQEKIDFLANLEKSTKNYDAYIEKNLVNDKSKTGIQQIVDYLKLR